MLYGEGSDAVPIPESREISNIEFFPGIMTGVFYQNYQIPGSLPAATVEDHLIQAIIRVNDACRSWRKKQIELGCSTLAGVPDAMIIDGKNHRETLYFRAVYCEAKAEILKETQTASRRERAENQAKTAEEVEDKYREFAQAAVRQMCGKNSIGVALI